MYNKKVEIKDISSYIIRGQNLVLKYLNNSVYLDNFKISDDVSNHYLIDNAHFIVYHNKEYTSQHLFNIGNLESQEIDNFLAIENERISDNIYLAKKMSRDFLHWQLVSYDIGSNKIIQEHPFKGIYFKIRIEDCIVYMADDKLCMSYLTGERCWEIGLSDFGFDPYDDSKYDSIKEVLGVAHGYVWIHTSGYRIIAISIESGDKKVVAEGFYIYLDAESQKIISLSSNIVAFIDTQGLVEEEKYNFLDIDPLGIGKYARVYAPLHRIHPTIYIIQDKVLFFK